MTRQEYIKKYTDAVLKATKGTKLFPSVMMAQAILESSDRHGNAGESTLARFFNNHFGIKADSAWGGKKVRLPTREVINGQSVTIEQPFRFYNFAENSFIDRNRFLKKNSRYEKAGVFAAGTPEEQAVALQKAGYATDPQYAQIIIRLIYDLELKTLDRLSKKNSTGEWERRAS